MSEDWDVEVPAVNQVTTITTSGGYNAPLATNNALRGMGRGQMLCAAALGGGPGPRPLRGAAPPTEPRSGNAVSNGGGDFGQGGGFGSGFGSGGGFGATGGGFGANGGGFGASGGSFDGGNNDGDGFGSGRRGGGGGQFGDRRGGGSGGGGSRACFKCGQDGHMSRDCPNPGSGGSRACYKCGQDGHMSRDCPNPGSGSTGGGSRACYKCGQEGHMSRDCPNPDTGAGRGGGRGGSQGGRGGSRSGCYKCGQEGHMSRDCTEGGSSSAGGFGGFGNSHGGNIEPRGGGFGTVNGFGGGFGGSNSNNESQGGFGSEDRSGGFGRTGGTERKGGCYKCGESGHMGRDCTKESAEGGSGRSGGSGDNKGCHKCGEAGHFARECTKEPAEGEKKRVPPYVPPPLPDDDEHVFETIQKGINFDKYDQIHVECTGHNAIRESDTISSFAGADLDDVFKENVHKAHYDKPTPIQKWAIPAIMKGRDLMSCAQTGSGKTAAFLLPVLTLMRRAGITGSAFSEIQEPQAIVIGPTRELVAQIYHESRKFARNTMIKSVVLYGGVSTQHNISEINKGVHIVIGTPGRLLDIINKGLIGLGKVQFLILDEADRMLDMGFLPAVKQLIAGLPSKADRQTLMFSATFPDEIQRLAQEILKDDYLFIVVGIVGGANTDIEQIVYRVDALGKREKLISILNESGASRTLVFVEQKRNADFLASFLSQTEFPTTSIHGDREQREREEALMDFKMGKAKVLVATSVAARGLDISGVDHVINYDMPSSIDEYVHRIGRTGRCGNIGRATSFFDPNSDQILARPLIKVLVDAHQQIPDWLEELAQASVGVGGFTNAGGRFGSRDTRRGVANNFGGRSGSDRTDRSTNFMPTVPSASAAFSTPGAGTNDDDEWD